MNRCPSLSVLSSFQRWFDSSRFRRFRLPKNTLYLSTKMQRNHRGTFLLWTIFIKFRPSTVHMWLINSRDLRLHLHKSNDPLFIKRIVGFRAGSEKAVCYYQFYVKMWQLFSFLWNVSLLALIAKWKITHKMISFNDLKKFPMEKYINGKPNIKENQFHTAFPKLCVYHLWPMTI